jgi:hypothetical protein
MRTSTPNYIATEQLIWLRQDGAQVLHSIFGLHGLRAPDRA